MTLVKWNRNGKTNGTNQSSPYNGNRPLSSSELGAALPKFFDVFPKSFFTNDLMQDFFDDTVNGSSGSIGTTVPAVNISENDTDLIIEVAAPGMSKKDFKLEIADNQLHISYNKENRKQGNPELNHWRKEFSFDSFERSFTLPAIVESDKIAAAYADGILRISITKKEEARRKPARLIEVR